MLRLVFILIQLAAETIRWWGPRMSIATIKLRSRPSAPWFVSEGRMGDGARIEERVETKGISTPRYPEMHQNARLRWRPNLLSTHWFAFYNPAKYPNR